MLRSPTIVNVPTCPDDLPRSLYIDHHVMLSRIRSALAKTIDNVIVRPGAEKLLRIAVTNFLSGMQARGDIHNFKVDDVTLVPAQRTFDEVTGLDPNACPGDPRLEPCPRTGKPRYAGVIVYSDGKGRGLVFRGHDGVDNAGTDSVKVQVSVRAAWAVAVDWLTITVQAGHQGGA